jgi:mannose-1-phosphate guanylyltransferase / mannose-6-phosphate isomerase
VRKIVPVVLAGGVGTRLWPMSTRKRPKQFQKIAASHTLFQETVLRASGLTEDVCFEKPIIITNRDYADIVCEQLDELGLAPETVILEPIGRNTAPAVATAALYAKNKHPDSLLLILPADHVVADVGAFRASIARGARVAAAGRLVTFGITPSGPETGYGYIQRGTPFDTGFEVAAFVEKPDRRTAESYLVDGRYYWNAGIFLFSVQSILQELLRYAPELLAQVGRVLSTSERQAEKIHLDPAAFDSIVPISIDYALMEKVRNAAVVPMQVGWSDVGSWTAFFEIDAGGNKQPSPFLHASEGTRVFSSGPKVAVIGVPDVLVVVTNEGTLVVGKQFAQEVKRAYAHFEEQ